MAYYIDEISRAISSDTRAQLLEQIDQTLSDLNSFERDPLIISTVKVLCSSVKVFAQQDSSFDSTRLLQPDQKLERPLHY